MLEMWRNLWNGMKIDFIFDRKLGPVSPLLHFNSDALSKWLKTKFHLRRPPTFSPKTNVST